MRKAHTRETTARREGLDATAPIYLKNVSVDPDGWVRDYEIAYLPDDVDPDEIKRALKDALNLDQPELIRVYDDEECYLEGHPGTPPQPRRELLHRRLGRRVGRALAAARPRRAKGLVVINGGAVPEHVVGRVTIVDFSELGEDCHTAAQVEQLANKIQRDFGPEARATVDDLRELAANKRHNEAEREAVVVGRVKAKWTELGEGHDGDYDPDDPDDEELLRFDFFALVAGKWLTVRDASYCTHVPASTPPGERRALLRALVDDATGTIEEGIRLLVADHDGDELAAAAANDEVDPGSRKVFERLSWIGPGQCTTGGDDREAGVEAA